MTCLSSTKVGQKFVLKVGSDVNLIFMCIY